MKTLKSIMQTAAVVLVSGAMAAAFAQTSPPPGKSLAASAGILAYPAKNQSPEQQTKDEAECYNWSKQESGYDPMSPPPPPAPTQASQPEQPAATGARAKGAVRGAAAGAIIGEVTDNDAGQGAAVGGTVGVLAGGRQARKAKAQQEQQTEAQVEAGAEQAKAAQQKLADTFKNGMSVCLDARGYAVK